MPKLIHHDTAHRVELTNEPLDQAIGAIVDWYDSVEAVLIGQVPSIADGAGAPRPKDHQRKRSASDRAAIDRREPCP
jgi:hypothetical protein